MAREPIRKAPRERYIVLSEKIKEEGPGLFSAFCSELDIATCANSMDEVVQKLHYTVLMVLNTAEAKGDISQYLKEKGVKVYPGTPPIALPKPKQTSQTVESGSWMRSHVHSLGNLQLAPQGA